MVVGASTNAAVAGANERFFLALERENSNCIVGHWNAVVLPPSVSGHRISRTFRTNLLRNFSHDAVDPMSVRH